MVLVKRISNKLEAVLQIIGVNRGNSGIIFDSVSPGKLCYESSLEPSCRDGFNERSQYVFIEK